MIDLNVYNTIDPAKGRLLITEPFEDSSYFNRSVILLCEHNHEGTFGFVLNNYLDIKLSSFEGFPTSEEMVFEPPIGLGGPVNSKNLYYIHTLGDQLKNAVHINGDIYAGGDFEQLKAMLFEGVIQEGQIRFFLGYSGWVEKQLEGELKRNAWLVADIADEHEIMDTNHKTLWVDYMRRQGGKYKAFAHFPKDPALN
ncbi:MAG: YqgE/AlgH family protein [Crocinitomicaceae bacterium]